MILVVWESKILSLHQFFAVQDIFSPTGYFFPTNIITKDNYIKLLSQNVDIRHEFNCGAGKYRHNYEDAREL